ncbi:acyl-CoA dehydrogenase family protein [Streptomyces rhizosphaericus]|uniref:acyl-CoA dehydrogenase family protein n=1 Tax=Streptomyces rhizosphaericus TaxID=114699 RepID=UPI000A365709|nr:acyl-CoA dehydrogenase family protein [Streptomyces rhizosphaericus]
MAALDRAEEFPAEACAVLDDFGLGAYYADARYGGLLRDHGELVQLLRTVARRDMTVAVAHGKTFLGSAPVWVAGDSAQAARLARAVSDGAVVSWALTERDHGSDLLAGELTARRVAGGWRLDGEKWLINNATRSRYLCVLARTGERAGPRAFSLFLVDKQQLGNGSYRTLPKVPTHGIRGADISGIAFDGALVPDDALVGAVGTGAETVLKTLQLTRTVCTALSLGALDHGLSIAADYAADRNLYGRRLAELPRVRRILGEACAGLVVAEAVSTVAARSIHTLTPELSVISAVTKACVPALVQDVLDRLGELLGVRGFLSDTYRDGAFAKLERDHRIVAIFDGSTAVNRSALIDHFPALARSWRRGAADADAVAATVPGEVPPPFDPGWLRLVSAGGCSLVQLLPEAVRRVQDAVRHGQLAPEVSGMADELRAVTERVHTGLERQQRTPRDVPQSAFDLAEQYEWCFAGSALIHLWLDGAHTPYDEEWLRAGLTLVLSRLGLAADEARAGSYDALADGLLRRGGHVPPSLLVGTGQEQGGNL